LFAEDAQGLGVTSTGDTNFRGTLKARLSFTAAAGRFAGASKFILEPMSMLDKSNDESDLSSIDDAWFLNLGTRGLYEEDGVFSVLSVVDCKQLRTTGDATALKVAVGGRVRLETALASLSADMVHNARIPP
jgi:hypothetical protein